MKQESDRAAAGVSVIRLTQELKEQAVDVLVQAFKTEATTVYHLDTQRPSTQCRMATLDAIFLQLYLEAGRPVVGAMKDGRVAGVGMVRDPRISISWRRAAALIVPELFQLLALFSRRPLRALRLLVAAKHPKGIPEPHFTFEVLGVHPDYQGEGAGKALMREVQAALKHEPSVSGIYLNTGSERNQAFYESLGYDTLRIVDLKAVKVYHMFWPNPTFS